MKKTRLFDIFRSKHFDPIDLNSPENVEPNPFAPSTRADGIDKFVRRPSPNRGLDKTARADVGSTGSKFIDMVRNVRDSDPYNHDSPRHTGYRGEPYLDPRLFTKDDDDLYLTPNDRSYRRNEFNQPEDVDDIDFDADWDFMRQLRLQNAEDEYDLDDDFEDDDIGLDDDLADLDDADSKLDGDDESQDGVESETIKYDGIVRAVKGAYLVSKKRQPDETFTEVWVYNTGKNHKAEAEIRKSIIAGTDIDPIKNYSEDGSQSAMLDTIGNVQYMTLIGLND